MYNSKVRKVFTKAREQIVERCIIVLVDFDEFRHLSDFY